MKRLLSVLLCLLALTALLIPVYAEDEAPAAEEQPAQEQAAEEAPAEEQPAEEAPAEEQPAEEAPAEEQPAEEQPAEEEKEETVRISLDLTDAWAGRAFVLTAPGGVSVQAAASEEGTVTFEAPSARYYAAFPAGGESPDPPEEIQAAEEAPEAAAEEDGVTILVYLGRNWAGTVFSARTELTDYPEEFSVSGDGVLTLSLEDSADFWAGTELTETAAAAADTETASKSSDSDDEEESSDLMIFLYFGGLAVIAVCYVIYRLRKRAAARTEDKKKEEDDEEDGDEYDDEDEDDEYGRFRREDGEDGPWRG